MTGNGHAAAFRPRLEGANIRTWIGFKHLMYVLEDALLQWFRERGVGPHRLYHDHGVSFQIVDASALFSSLLEIDDAVVANVTSTGPGRFSVTLSTRHGDAEDVVARSKVTVVLVEHGDVPGSAPLPDDLRPLVVPGVSAASGDPEIEDLRPFRWSWRARYFHCHSSRLVQHSAYVRALEEVVDRFLDDRGLSIPRLLDERAWIPVVSRARVRVLADAYMDETIHTTFAVQGVLRGTAYDAQMDCHVERDGRRVRTATARILHGYAISRGADAGRLVDLDAATVEALTVGRAR